MQMRKHSVSLYREVSQGHTTRHGTRGAKLFYDNKSWAGKALSCPGQGFPRQACVLAGESMAPKQREATFLKGRFIESMGTVTPVSVGRSLCCQLWD